MQDLNQLIDELLTRELRPNTREDLGTFRKEIAAGKLSADDARYIRALHARVVGGNAPLAGKKDEDGESRAEPNQVEQLQGALAEARQREEALVAERDKLQSTIADLRRELDALKASKV
jgi:hypothetical protein